MTLSAVLVCGTARLCSHPLLCCQSPDCWPGGPGHQHCHCMRCRLCQAHSSSTLPPLTQLAVGQATNIVTCMASDRATNRVGWCWHKVLTVSGCSRPLPCQGQAIVHGRAVHNVTARVDFVRVCSSSALPGLESATTQQAAGN